MGVAAVVNMAPDRVPSHLDALRPEHRQYYVDVRHPLDGEGLRDVVGEEVRFMDCLPQALEAVVTGLHCGRVFIHCQMGRSRSAAVVVAHLLRTHEHWSLFDAVAFVAARRPEVELNRSYAEALDEWALGLGRPSTLTQIAELLPRHLRPAGVSRDVAGDERARQVPEAGDAQQGLRRAQTGNGVRRAMEETEATR